MDISMEIEIWEWDASLFCMHITIALCKAIWLPIDLSTLPIPSEKKDNHPIPERSYVSDFIPTKHLALNGRSQALLDTKAQQLALQPDQLHEAPQVERRHSFSLRDLMSTMYRYANPSE